MVDRISTRWLVSILLITGEKSDCIDCCMREVSEGYTSRLRNRLSTPGINRDALERTISD